MIFFIYFNKPQPQDFPIKNKLLMKDRLFYASFFHLFSGLYSKKEKTSPGQWLPVAQVESGGARSLVLGPNLQRAVLINHQGQSTGMP
jgi:hypothetical protein